jgi:hypothetical protein
LESESIKKSKVNNNNNIHSSMKTAKTIKKKQKKTTDRRLRITSAAAIIKRSSPITIPILNHHSEDDDVDDGKIPFDKPILKRQNAMFLERQDTMENATADCVHLLPPCSLSALVFEGDDDDETKSPPLIPTFSEFLKESMERQETIPLTLNVKCESDATNLKVVDCNACGRNSYMFCPHCAEEEAKDTMNKMYDGIWSFDK